MAGLDASNPSLRRDVCEIARSDMRLSYETQEKSPDNSSGLFYSHVAPVKAGFAHGLHAR